MIEIKNLKNEYCINPWDVRVDRSNKFLGNKFYMASENMRDKVCDLYAEWLKNNMNSILVKAELNRLLAIYNKYGKLNLFCWCYPKRCHAEEIKKVLINMKKFK